MPGFSIGGTGGEQRFGNRPNSLNEMRRQHRWVFTALGALSTKVNQGRDVMLILQKAARPTFNLAEAVMHHNQEEVYYAGKQTWDALNLSFYDGEQDPDSSKAMWNWVNTVAVIPDANVEPPTAYKSAQASLEMVDGKGKPNESWTIYNGWPKKTNWNSLDYTSSEICLIEVEFRYDRAVHN